jgi:hypothetical protein
MGNPPVGTQTSSTTPTCTTAVSPTSKLLGGGGAVTQGSGAKGGLTQSQPFPTSGTPTAWTAQATVFVSGTGNVGVTPYAICSLP